MTKNHDYTVPDKGATDWHVPLNNNFAALDRDVPVWATEGNKDSYVPLDGSHLIATDTGAVYEGNGSSWVQIGSIGSGGPELYSQESAPSDPNQDDVWFDQSEGSMKFYDGSNWIASTGGSTSETSSTSTTTGDVYIPMDDMTVSEAYDTSYGAHSDNFEIVSGDSFAGSHYLDSQLSSGGHWGGNLFYYFPDHGGQPDEVYSRICLRLDSNWEMADDTTTCKLYWAGANLGAGDGGHGGGGPTGDNGWSVRVFCQGSSSDGTITPASYIYHMDQSGTYGDMINWSDKLQIGEWHQIDTYVKLNSVSNGSANHDGVYRAWLDGNLQDEHTDLRWRTTDSIGCDRIGPGTYWGGSEVSPRENHVHFDEHHISTGKEGL